MVESIANLREEIGRLQRYQQHLDRVPVTSPGLHERIKRVCHLIAQLQLGNLFVIDAGGEDWKEQFVNSEPIIEIEEEGNFTVTPPERPASAPLRLM